MSKCECSQCGKIIDNTEDMYLVAVSKVKPVMLQETESIVDPNLVLGFCTECAEPLIKLLKISESYSN